MTSLDLCTIPAGVPPNGVYNFVDPPTMAPAVIAVGIVLCVISTVFGAVRLYTNKNRMHSADCEFIASKIKQISRNTNSAMS